MAEYLNKGLVNATSDLKEQLNDRLVSLSSEPIGTNDEEYYRTSDFVEFNNWLQKVSRQDLTSIILDFGFLPMVYSLSGINITTAAIMQKESIINLRGYIRYINMAIIQVVGKQSEGVIKLGTEFFGDNFKYDEAFTASDLRSKFAAGIIEYFVNTRNDITYEQSLGRFVKLVSST